MVNLQQAFHGGEHVMHHTKLNLFLIYVAWVGNLPFFIVNCVLFVSLNSALCVLIMNLKTIRKWIPHCIVTTTSLCLIS